MEFDRNKSLVKQELLLNSLPEWWTEINPEDYYLVLTDDVDSLFSTKRLNTLFGVDIGGFYDFHSGL